MNYKTISLKLKTVLLTGLLALSSFFATAANNGNEPAKINLATRGSLLKDIFSQLSDQSKYQFSYGEKIINDTQSYAVKYNDISFTAVMNDLSRRANFKYSIKEDVVLVKKTAIAVAVDQQTVTGTVLDNNGTPLPGASVQVVGSSKGTTTDFDGKFSIEVSSGQMLKISYVGFAPQEVSAQNGISVQLEPDAAELNEVLVVGYGSQTRKDVTGAVSQVTAENFKQGVNISPDNLIQGKVAGVRVVNTSGEPGAGVNVNIRGVGSIRSGSTPLFVVDGVPLSNEDVSPSGTNVGFGASQAKNPLNFLNTSDIESINILKDASAAAIYGARGSNGVVIITTKKGKLGKAGLTLDNYMGVSTVARKLDLLDASEYRSAITNESYDHGGNTDWQDEIYRTAITRNHNIAYAKSTDSGNYYVSLSNMDQEGIVNTSSFQRTTGRINAAESFFYNKRLRLKVNLTASETVDNGVPNSDDGGSNGQLIIHTLMANPTWSVKDENGDFTNFNLNAHYNPAYLLSIYEDQSRTLRVLGNFEAAFRIVDGLEYKMNLGVDRSSAERNTTIYPNLTDLNPLGRYVQNNVESKSALIEHYLTYKGYFGAHELEVLGGFSYQKFENSGSSFQYDDIADQETGIPPSNNPGYAGVNTATSGFAQENELQSFFGRVNYSFDDKYLLTASLRADGSTRFGENNKYGYFPSFAAGWNLDREAFLKENDIIDNLKLRASWGQTGNQEVQNKITQASYSLSPNEGYYLYPDYALINGVSVARTPNPNLKWEVVTQLNVGTDFTLFGGKLYGTLDYYNKTTTDAILFIPSPALSPTDNIWTNIDGKIVNKGFEFMLGTEVINKDGFTWDVDVNGATLNNEIKDLPVSEILSGVISGPGQSGVLANIYKSGYAAGSFYLFEHDGFDAQGFDKFKDQNGDGIISSDDRVIIEGALPKFSYGLNSSMRLNNFDFSFSIIGQTGGYLINNTGLNALNINNLASDRNVAQRYLDSGANPANAPQLSTYYLEKSDFLRLNTARLGYTWSPENINWINSINLYVTGQNILTLTDYSGYDPLIDSPKNSNGNQSIGIDYTSYPTASTYILGATIKL